MIQLSNITSSSKKLRSEGMKSGYEAELNARISELDQAKSALETLYMGKDTEEAILADEVLQSNYIALIDKVSSIVTVLNGTVKTVKLAVETCLIFNDNCCNAILNMHAMENNFKVH